MFQILCKNQLNFKTIKMSLAKTGKIGFKQNGSTPHFLKYLLQK